MPACCPVEFKKKEVELMYVLLVKSVAGSLQKIMNHAILRFNQRFRHGFCQASADLEVGDTAGHTGIWITRSLLIVLQYGPCGLLRLLLMISQRHCKRIDLITFILSGLFVIL